MNIGNLPNSLEELIAAQRDRLTPTERRIAQTLLEDRTLLAFGTVSDLANTIGTSRPTVVRFAGKLGFKGYPELQRWAREALATRLLTPTERIRQPATDPDSPAIAIERAVHHALETLEGPLLRRLATPIVRAEHVWIVSGETSLAGAHVLNAGLSMLRPRVHLVSEHAAGRELCGAHERDTVIALDFARYRRHAITTARSLAEGGTHIIAITDSPLSPLSALTEDRCELNIPGIGPFDSAAPAVVAAELLVAQVAAQLGDAARERIDRLEERWRALGTFLTDEPRNAANTPPQEKAPE